MIPFGDFRNPEPGRLPGAGAHGHQHRVGSLRGQRGAGVRTDQVGQGGGQHVRQPWQTDLRENDQR